MELVFGLDVICRSTDMPMAVKGAVKKSNGVYYIYINNRLCEEEQALAVAHEIDHIVSGDLETDYSAAQVEKYNHYMEANKDE